MRTSSTRQPGTSGRLLFRNSCAEAKACTRSPTDPMRFLSDSRICASSPMTNTMASGSVMSPLAASLHCELKRRAPVVIRCRPEPPAVCLDNRAADRPSHAPALRVGGRERGEDVIEPLRIAPRAGIPYGDPHALRLIFRGADLQLSRTVVDSTHGFDGIVYQIENHLLYLYSVSQHARVV